jgi:hypothetical protein
LQHLLARDAEPRAQRVVFRIGKRHDRIQAVVAAFQLDQHEEIAVLRLPRIGEGARHRRCGERRQGEEAHELAAMHGLLLKTRGGVVT